MYSAAIKARRLSHIPLEALPEEEVDRIMNRARQRYEEMGQYDVKRADRIAGRLFLDLVRPWLGNPILLGRYCGISPVALWKWRTRRAPVHIDTVCKACDKLARKLISSATVAEEAASLMAGIPWTGRKSGSELLAYAVVRGLSARCLFQLARRQERLNAPQYARMLGINADLLTRLSSALEGDRQYEVWRGSYQLDLIARRFGLIDADVIAEFKLLVWNGEAVPRLQQREIVRAFRERIRHESRAVFLRGFLSLLRERHGFLNNRELADAVIERIAMSGEVDAFDAIRLTRRLSNIIKPTHTCVWLQAEWAVGMAELAFPGETNGPLRDKLILYLAARNERAIRGKCESQSLDRPGQVHRDRQF